MRILSAILLLAILTNSTVAQGPESKSPVRYGIMLNSIAYSQATPKETLAAVIKAVEDHRFDVLVAHLIEEQLIEKRAAEHGRTLEGDAEKSLLALRQKQQSDPFRVKPAERIPNEPKAFAAIVQEEAKQLGFKATIDEVRKKYASDVTLVKELKRYLRDGDVTGAGDNAKISLKGVPGKALFFVKVNNRWFVEDRQEEKEVKNP